MGRKMEFIDPDDVRDTFCSGLALVEMLEGDMVRFWLYSEEQGTKIIRSKLVMRVSTAFNANHRTQMVLNAHKPLRLVKS